MQWKKNGINPNNKTMDREEMKDLAELNDNYQKVMAENERLKGTLNKLYEQNMCSHAGDELIKEVLLITNP